MSERKEITIEDLLDEAPPESVPEMPGVVEAETMRKDKSLQGREAKAAHEILDRLGVPTTRVLSPKETVGGKKAVHVLRLHGRLRLLSEALAKRGVDNLFPKQASK